MRSQVAMVGGEREEMSYDMVRIVLEGAEVGAEEAAQIVQKSLRLG